MNELITTKELSEFPVNCRDVHERVESKKDYTDWIKGKIDKFGFVSGVDYSPSQGKNAPGKRGRPTSEYHCSYDMAKELCLVENTPKGREVRQYFIEAEKKFKQMTIEMTPAEQLLLSAQRLVDQERRLKAVVKQVEEVSIEARQDHDTLSADQIAELDSMMSDVVAVTGDKKDFGRMKREIKSACFKIAGTRTYKEIARRDFEKAKEIISQYFQ